MKTRTWYLLAATCFPQFAGGSGMETMSLSPDHNTMPLALQPVWSVVEQTSEAGPDYGSLSERMVASGLTLIEAQRRLAGLRAPPDGLET